MDVTLGFDLGRSYGDLAWEGLPGAITMQFIVAEYFERFSTASGPEEVWPEGK